MTNTSSRFRDDRVRLASIGGAVLLIALAISVVITVSRYQNALAADRSVSRAHTNALVAQEAVTSFWSERESMNEYIVVPSPALLAEVRQRSAKFDRDVDSLDRSTAAERTLVARTHAGARAFERAFARAELSAGKSVAAENMAIDTLNGPEDGVLAPLSSLQRLSQT
jgi:hypothetical protein